MRRWCRFAHWRQRSTDITSVSSHACSVTDGEWDEEGMATIAPPCAHDQVVRAHNQSFRSVNCINGIAGAKCRFAVSQIEFYRKK
jgi:hypothetical protein